MGNRTGGQELFIDDITFEVKGLGREVKPKSVVGGRIYDDKF